MFLDMDHPLILLFLIDCLALAENFIVLIFTIYRLSTSDNLLVSIQEKIKWGDAMSEIDKKHKKEVEEQAEDVKKTLSLKVG